MTSTWLPRYAQQKPLRGSFIARAFVACALLSNLSCDETTASVPSLLDASVATRGGDQAMASPPSNTSSANDPRGPGDASLGLDAGPAQHSIEQIQIQAGNYRFDARAAGPAQGPLVLLLHGFPETSYQYRSQLTALAQAGFRAVAPNQRGYSPGARPTDVADYGILDLAQDIIQIANALGAERFHLVGHDWGGGIAWTLGRFYPKRVASLTVLSTPHPDAFNLELSDQNSCQYAASAYFDAFTGPDAVAYLRGTKPGSMLSFECLMPEDLAEYTKIISDDAALGAALNWYRANVVNRKFNTPAVGLIAVPTLYMWGESDPTFCRATAERTRDYVSGPYEFVAVSGVGHWLTDCVPELVNQKLLAHLTTYPVDSP